MASLSRRPSEPESAVTISRNAKGIAQFEVTVRGPNPDECDSLARMIFDSLVSEYPYPVTTNGGE